MLGLVRTTFALMVMTYHLFFGRESLGYYPVFGFYTISGYLMSLIMHESYGYTWQGRYSFVVNRFLRLYPQYWAAVAISVSLIHLLGNDAVRSFHASVFLPSTTSEYIENIFMAFGAWNPNDVNPRLVPPTWALTVEIFFYILICMGISRTFARVKIWLSLSLLYVVASFILGLPSQERYFPFAAASLPFAIGSCIYFLSKDEEVYALYLRLRISAKSIFLLVLANCLIFTQIRFGSLFADVGLYINLGLCALLVYSVIKGERIINIGDSLDKRIGDFSYPIYLLHWQMGLVASYLIYGSAFHEFSYRGWVSATVAMVLSVLMSLIFITVLDKPLQIIRSRIKRNTVLQGQSPPGSG